MKTVYDVGYMSIKDSDLLHKAIVELGAVLIDCRFSPRSRDPKWNISKLKEVFGDDYIHMKELGNENYKGGPVKLVDPAKGLNRLLALDKPVVLMCGCWNRETCHRHDVVKLIAKTFPGTEIVPLDKKSVSEIATRREPKQEALFTLDLE